VAIHVPLGGIGMSVGDSVRDALQATEGETPEVKAAVAAAAAGAAVPEPSLPSDVGFLWKALVVGMLTILVIALGGSSSLWPMVTMRRVPTLSSRYLHLS